MLQGYQALSDKEKETLRLILRGHDAKSMARELALSVHTINERLRSARRKLEVTSSKEAARLLMEKEGEAPQLLADKQLGDEQGQGDAARPGFAKAGTVPAWNIGATLMLLTLAILTLSPALPSLQADSANPAPIAAVTNNAEKEDAAREWLALTDAGDWQASYDATGSAFQELNTADIWEAASFEARVPLGAVTRRDAISFQHLAAPPMGYWQVRFSTDFAQRQDVIESVTLEREDGQLRVVGYIIE